MKPCNSLICNNCKKRGSVPEKNHAWCPVILAKGTNKKGAYTRKKQKACEAFENKRA